MSFKYSFAVLLALFIAQPAFADMDMSDDPACATIAKSCQDAGYTGHGTEAKQFWKDCMKPLVMGKTVDGVTVDPKDASACRAAKIKHMQQELNDMLSVK